DLAVEQLGRPDAALGPAGAELRVGHGVEGARGDGVAQAERPEAGAELGGRLAGEREGEDVARVGVVGGDAVADAAGEGAGLARPGAGEDAQGRGRGRDRGALRVVEVVDEPGRVHGATLPRGSDSIGGPGAPTSAVSP